MYEINQYPEHVCYSGLLLQHPSGVPRKLLQSESPRNWNLPELHCRPFAEICKYAVPRQLGVVRLVFTRSYYVDSWCHLETYIFRGRFGVWHACKPVAQDDKTHIHRRKF